MTKNIKSNYLKNCVERKTAVEVINANQEREFRHLCKKNNITCFLKDFEERKRNNYPLYFILDYKDIAGLIAMICYSKDKVMEFDYQIEAFKIYKKMIKVEAG